MSSKDEVTIYGAGMSGLIAAINLAREGRSVTVHEKEAGFGGSRLYNPSTHVTPIDAISTSEYIGIDITGVFHPLLKCRWYLHDTSFLAPPSAFGLNAVERGDRPTSLDTLLYRECQGLDIRFEFESSLRKEDIGNLPPNTIIACGLTPSVYRMLDIPCRRWYGWISRGEIEMNDYALLWWDESITEYGYLSTVNNFYFNLLFSTREVPRGALNKYIAFLVRNEGIEHDNWEYASGVVPIAVPDNPRLFWKNAVLCGTISGAMDPVLCFGISGALVTGKIAALAITDPDRARSEFERFTRNFKRSYRFRATAWDRVVRSHVRFGERMISAVGSERIERILQKGDTGLLRRILSIPGFGPINTS